MNPWSKEWQIKEEYISKLEKPRRENNLISSFDSFALINIVNDNKIIEITIVTKEKTSKIVSIYDIVELIEEVASFIGSEKL